MMSEPIYKMQPAGHDAPSQKREYEVPDKRLSAVFEEWLSVIAKETVPDIEGQYEIKSEKWYNLAEKALGSLKPSAAEANLLPKFYKGDFKLYYSGLFLSAIYNRSSDKRIVIDLELEELKFIDFVGYGLPEDKTLVNMVRIGSHFGSESKGLVINRGLTESMGDSSSGAVINFGDGGSNFAWNASGVALNYGAIYSNELFNPAAKWATGTVISFQELQIWMSNYRSIRILQPHDITRAPELQKYLENLRKNPERSPKTIKHEIEEILLAAGHDIRPPKSVL